jgi:hypothetical protein
VYAAFSLPSGATCCAAPKELKRVPLERKIGGGGNRSKRLWRQTSIYLHNAATLHTREVMVMTPFCCCTTHPIAMCAIAKLNTIEHALRDQVIYRTKDSGAADP